MNRENRSNNTIAHNMNKQTMKPIFFSLSLRRCNKWHETHKFIPTVCTVYWKYVACPALNAKPTAIIMTFFFLFICYAFCLFYSFYLNQMESTPWNICDGSDHGTSTMGKIMIGNWMIGICLALCGISDRWDWISE